MRAHIILSSPVFHDSVASWREIIFFSQRRKGAGTQRTVEVLPVEENYFPPMRLCNGSDHFIMMVAMLCGKLVAGAAVPFIHT